MVHRPQLGGGVMRYASSTASAQAFLAHRVQREPTPRRASIRSTSPERAQMLRVLARFDVVSAAELTEIIGRDDVSRFRLSRMLARAVVDGQAVRDGHGLYAITAAGRAIARQQRRLA